MISRRVKASLGFAVCGIFGAFYWWMIWKSSPALAAQMIEYNKAHPMSWLDFGLGCVTTFMTMAVIMIGASLRESKRFEKDIEAGNKGGPGGSGGRGQKKIVRLPMSRKTLEIGDWRKAPTDGHIH